MKLFFVCVWFFAALLPPASAAPPGLVVLLLPATSLQDWQSADAPHLHQLMRTGAIAVMNTRTAHRAGRQEEETPQAALLTLGAGSRAAGSGAAQAFLPASALGPSATAGALYTRRTGLILKPGQSVCLSWPAAVRANTALGYDLSLGSLAHILAALGVKVEAGGGPSADWVAADGGGTVRRVPVLHAAPGTCLIWDAGTDVSAADAAIGTAAAQCAAGGSRLLVLSPYAGSAETARQERLTPVLFWGDGIPAGLLSSQSTHRPGLVTNTDFAPSVAANFRIGRSGFRPLPFGFAWTVKAAPNGAETAAQISQNAVRQARGMTLLPYFALGLGLWILAATVAARRLSAAGRQPSGLWIAAPLGVLTSALFALSAASFWTLLTATLFLLLLTRSAGAGTVFTVWAAGMTLALCADMAFGNTFLPSGLLGYSAIEGARYYGIGNEAMGLLLGAALTAAARLWPLGRIVQALLLLLMTLIVVLLGTAGAKAGGVMVSLVVFGAFLYTASGRRWNMRAALLLGYIAAGGMALMAAAGVLLPYAHSHIGEAINRIASGGPGEAWDIIERKLTTEGRLAYHSAWTALLWLGTACTGFLWKHAQKQGRALRSAGAMGIFACLLLNDAGVVAAALFVVVLWCEVMTQKKPPAQEAS